MNPDNDPDIHRYKLCASQVLEVGVFKFEIGVDWPVSKRKRSSKYHSRFMNVDID